MNILSPLPEIAAAVAEHDSATKKLKDKIKEVQRRCPHPIILESDIYGNEIRLCPHCGVEEQAPFYHSFLFEYLKKADHRVFINKDSEIFKYRVGYSDINFRQSSLDR